MNNANNVVRMDIKNQQSENTNPSTVLQFWDWQYATLYVNHVTSDCNAECLQVRVIVELGFRHLSEQHMSVF